MFGVELRTRTKCKIQLSLILLSFFFGQFLKKLQKKSCLDTESMCQTDTNINVFLFAYGSLIWRPGLFFFSTLIRCISYNIEGFNFLYKFTGYVRGYQRRFYQKCRFHRGTNEQPGRVVTLIQTNDPQDVVYGVCYCISAHDSIEILKQLDFREQGGYVRMQCGVHKQEDEGQIMFMEEPFVNKAIVYVGGIKQDDDFVAEQEERHLDRLATVIASSKGPSGLNRDYLFNLATHLRQLKVGDDHVFALESRVRELVAHEEPTPQKQQLPITLKGTIYIDNGAVAAVSSGKALGLYPVGVVGLDGSFSKGELVQLVDYLNKRVVSKGFTNYSSDEILKIKGKHSKRIKEVLNFQDDCEEQCYVVSKRNMILV